MAAKLGAEGRVLLLPTSCIAPRIPAAPGEFVLSKPRSFASKGGQLSVLFPF